MLYKYQWLDEMVGTPPGQCRACDTLLVPHMYGAPLMVCPSCYPEEAYLDE